jgi:hypothetical protein
MSAQMKDSRHDCQVACLSHKDFRANHMPGGHRKQPQLDHWFDADIDT